jgi:hypothetical protein
MKKRRKLSAAKATVNYGDYKYPGTTTRSQSKTKVPVYKKIDAAK